MKDITVFVIGMIISSALTKQAMDTAALRVGLRTH